MQEEDAKYLFNEPIPEDLLDYWVKVIERQEFWTDVFVNSNCLTEDDENVIRERGFIARMKRQLLKQGRTVQMLREIELINGCAVFPDQEEPIIPLHVKEIWDKANQIESEMLRLLIEG